MKRLVLLIAAALYCSLAYAQDAGDVGNGAQLSIVSRLEAEPYFSFDPGGESGLSLGSSSIYTFLDGTFGDSFTYSVSNHWLSAEPSELYDYLGYSDSFNWLDWAYISYAFGDFEAELGKDVMGIAAYEFDANDVDVYWQLSSTLWNTLPYQWGAKLAWYPTETAMLRGEITSSPFSEHPFEDGLICAGIIFRDDRDDFSWMASANSMGTNFDHNLNCLFLGTQIYGDNYTIGADLSVRAYDKLNNVEYLAMLTADIQATDDLVLKARAGYESSNGYYDGIFSLKNYLFGGVAAEYSLSKALEGLSLHCAVGANSLDSCAYLTIGAKYNFTINF